MKGGGEAALQCFLVSWAVHLLDMAPTDCPALYWAMEVENRPVLEQIY